MPPSDHSLYGGLCGEVPSGDDYPEEWNASLEVSAGSCVGGVMRAASTLSPTAAPFSGAVGYRGSTPLVPSVQRLFDGCAGRTLGAGAEAGAGANVQTSAPAPASGVGSGDSSLEAAVVAVAAGRGFGPEGDGEIGDNGALYGPDGVLLTSPAVGDHALSDSDRRMKAVASVLGTVNTPNLPGCGDFATGAVFCGGSAVVVSGALSLFPPRCSEAEKRRRRVEAASRRMAKKRRKKASRVLQRTQREQELAAVRKERALGRAVESTGAAVAMKAACSKVTEPDHLRDGVSDSAVELYILPVVLVAGLMILTIVGWLFRTANRPMEAIYPLRRGRSALLGWVVFVIYAIVALGWWSSVCGVPMDRFRSPCDISRATTGFLLPWRYICQVFEESSLSVGCGLWGVGRVPRLIWGGWLGCRGVVSRVMAAILSVLCCCHGFVIMGILSVNPALYLSIPAEALAGSTGGFKVPVAINTSTDIEWSSAKDACARPGFSHRQSSSVPMPKSRLCRALRGRRRRRLDSVVASTWFRAYTLAFLCCPELWPQVDTSPVPQLGQPAWRIDGGSPCGSPWGSPLYGLAGMEDENTVPSFCAPPVSFTPILDLLDVAALGFTMADMDGVVDMGEADPVRRRPVEPPGTGPTASPLSDQVFSAAPARVVTAPVRRGAEPAPLHSLASAGDASAATAAITSLPASMPSHSALSCSFLVDSGAGRLFLSADVFEAWGAPSIDPIHVKDINGRVVAADGGCPLYGRVRLEDGSVARVLLAAAAWSSATFAENLFSPGKPNQQVSGLLILGNRACVHAVTRHELFRLPWTLRRGYGGSGWKLSLGRRLRGCWARVTVRRLLVRGLRQCWHRCLPRRHC